MRAIALIALFFLSSSIPRFFAQSDQQPSTQKPKADESSAQQPGMKIYDVPSAPTSSDQSPEEATDYLKLRQIQDPRQGVVLIEDFLKKYPNSKYTTVVRIGAVSLYQQLNNYEKIVEHGEQVLTNAPSNFRVLTSLALAYMTHGETNKAVERASKSISALDNLPKPANSADLPNWNAERDLYLAMDYATLGSVFLSEYEQNRKREKEAKATVGGASPSIPVPPVEPQQEGGPSMKSGPPTSASASTPTAISSAKAYGYLTKAVELMPRYDFAQFQLGVLFAYRNEADKAINSFAKAVAIGGGFAPSARKNLEAVYKVTHKNSLDGLENLVSKAKEELGTTAVQAKPEQPSPGQ